MLQWMIKNIHETNRNACAWKYRNQKKTKHLTIQWLSLIIYHCMSYGSSSKEGRRPCWKVKKSFKVYVLKNRPKFPCSNLGKHVILVVKQPVVRAPSGENAEWWKSRVVSAPNGESAGGENAVVRTPMVRCPVTVAVIGSSIPKRHLRSHTSTLVNEIENTFPEKN